MNGHRFWQFWAVLMVVGLFLISGKFIHALYLEDDSAVWVNLTPPKIVTPIVTSDAGSIESLWHGYRRRACAKVSWTRVIVRESDGAIVYKLTVPATSAEKTEPKDEPSTYVMAIPTLPPGKYSMNFIEEAWCNAIKPWRNDTGSVQFEVVQ